MNLYSEFKIRLRIGLSYPLKKIPLIFGLPDDVFWVRQMLD